MVNIPLVKDGWVLISDANTTIQLKADGPFNAYLHESTIPPTFEPDDGSDVVVIPPIELFDFTYTDKSLWAYTTFANSHIVKDI